MLEDTASQFLDFKTESYIACISLLTYLLAKDHEHIEEHRDGIHAMNTMGKEGT